MGWAIDVALVVYAAGRFLIGFATVDRTHLGLGLSQWIALAVIVAVGWYIWRARDRVLVPRSST